MRRRGLRNRAAEGHLLPRIKESSGKSVPVDKGGVLSRYPALESAPLATPSGCGRRSQHRQRDAEGSAHGDPRARHPNVETISQGFQTLWLYSAM